MRFSNDFLDEIRDRVPISAVIGARVPWDRKKTNVSRGDYWACCPFHGEKARAFTARIAKAATIASAAGCPAIIFAF